MKTAEEWAKEIPSVYEFKPGLTVIGVGSLISIILAAQRDAIEAAAKMAEQVRKNSEPVRYNEQHVYDYDEGAMSASSEILGAIRSLLPFAQSAPRE